MTRKDYILIAKALRKAREAVESNHGQADSEMLGFEYGLEGIVRALEADNSRFDRAHFVAVVRGEKDLNSKPARKEERPFMPTRFGCNQPA